MRLLHRASAESRHRLRSWECGAAVIEMVFVFVFVMLLTAFVVQQVHFAQDFMKTVDEITYDLIAPGHGVRADELQAEPGILSGAERNVRLRPVALLSAIIKQDREEISRTLTLTAAGGTRSRVIGTGGYGMARDPLATNAWQLQLSGPLKVVAAGRLRLGIGDAF